MKLMRPYQQGLFTPTLLWQIEHFAMRKGLEGSISLSEGTCYALGPGCSGVLQRVYTRMIAH